MANLSLNSPVLLLEGFILSPDASFSVWLSLLLAYIFIVTANAIVVAAVIADRRLHQPMYLLYCNVAVNDVVANTNAIPRVLTDLVRPESDRFITYHECVCQAFLGHLVATSARTILMVMAYDRYVAICDPLRYALIMTNKMLVKLMCSAWTAAIVAVSILLGLTIRLNRCRLLVRGLYCSNAGLFSLSCESVVVNNIYGLTFTAVLYACSVGSMVLTYSRITVVCLTNNSKSLNSKALRTCSSHIAVYLVSLFSGMMVITFSRFPHLTQERNLASILYYIIPGSLNPIIYGLQSKEIRNHISGIFRSRKVLP